MFSHTQTQTQTHTHCLSCSPVPKDGCGMEWSAWSGADTVPRGTRIVLRVVLLLLDTPCWPFVCLFVFCSSFVFAFHAHAHPSTFVSASHAVVLLHMTKDQMNTAGLPNASEHKKKNPNTRTHKKTKPQQGGKKKKKKKRKRKRKQNQAITKHNRARQATTKAERAKFGARGNTQLVS